MITEINKKLARKTSYYLVILLGFVVAAVSIRDYLMLMHNDTFIHSILIPNAMLHEGRWLLDNLPYSNKDNRTIAIATVHVFAAKLFPSDPRLAFYVGSAALSAIFVVALGRAGMKMRAPLIVMAPLMFYLAISPARLFFEHMHGQSSYVIEQSLLLFILGSVASFYIARENDGRVKLWPYLTPIFICIVIAMATGINRAVVTTIAPLFGAYIGCIVLRIRQDRPSAIDFKVLSVFCLSALCGLIAFKLIESQIYYTIGVARPFSFENKEGQIKTLFDMVLNAQRLTDWGLSSSAKTREMRDILAIALSGYLVVRSVWVLIVRKSAVQVFAVLFACGVIAILAVALNFADIRPRPRYMLPPFISIVFVLIVFSAQARRWEQYFLAICLSGLCVAAIESAQGRHTYATWSQENYQKIEDILIANDVEVGISHMEDVGMLNLNMGVGSFIPVIMRTNGNLHTLPFHTDFYYNDYKAAEKSALVYVVNHPLGRVTDDIIDGFLNDNGLEVLEDETIKILSYFTRVVVVKGDLRRVFPGSPEIKTPARRVVTDQTKVKVGTVQPGQACRYHIDVPEGTLGFSYADSGFMVSPGRYEINFIFDGAEPPPGKMILSIGATGQESVFRGALDGQPIPFEVTQIGGLRIILFGKDISGFKYCGHEIRRLRPSDEN